MVGSRRRRGRCSTCAVLRDLPEINSLRDYRPNLITRVLDVDGNEIASFAKERRVIIPIEEVPKHVVDAFIAAEDGSFYEHKGLDYAGILRAAFDQRRSRAARRRARARSPSRSRRPSCSAPSAATRASSRTWCSRGASSSRSSKNDILYLYLNQIYFGAGAYGIEAAAQTYFGKSARDLQVHEAALIAGLVPRPAEWNPHVDPETARRKQLLVLHRMVEKGFLPQAEQHDYLGGAAARVRARPTGRSATPRRAFFVEEVRRYLMERFGGDEVLTGGLTVHTTLDVGDQVVRLARGAPGPARPRPAHGLPRPDPQRAREGVAAAVLAEIDDEQRGRAGARRRSRSTRRWCVALDDKAERRRSRSARRPRSARSSRSPTSSWALPPDPHRDGMNARAPRVGQVLHKGDLVLARGRSAGRQDATFALYQKPLAEGALRRRRPREERARDDGRRLQLRVERVRPRAAVEAPARLGVQADRLRGGARARLHARHDRARHRGGLRRRRATASEWKPENYTEDFYGPITLRTALAKSRNAATIRVLSEIGLAPVRDMAQARWASSPRWR